MTQGMWHACVCRGSGGLYAVFGSACECSVELDVLRMCFNGSGFFLCCSFCESE